MAKFNSTANGLWATPHPHPSTTKPFFGGLTYYLSEKWLEQTETPWTTPIAKLFGVHVSPTQKCEQLLPLYHLLTSDLTDSQIAQQLSPTITKILASASGELYNKIGEMGNWVDHSGIALPTNGFMDSKLRFITAYKKLATTCGVSLDIPLAHLAAVGGPAMG